MDYKLRAIWVHPVSGQCTGWEPIANPVRLSFDYSSYGTYMNSGVPTGERMVDLESVVSFRMLSQRVITAATTDEGIANIQAAANKAISLGLEDKVDLFLPGEDQYIVDIMVAPKTKDTESDWRAYMPPAGLSNLPSEYWRRLIGECICKDRGTDAAQANIVLYEIAEELQSQGYKYNGYVAEEGMSGISLRYTHQDGRERVISISRGQSSLDSVDILVRGIKNPIEGIDVIAAVSRSGFAPGVGEIKGTTKYDYEARKLAPEISPALMAKNLGITHGQTGDGRNCIGLAEAFALTLVKSGQASNVLREGDVAKAVATKMRATTVMSEPLGALQNLSPGLFPPPTGRQPDTEGS